MAVSYKRLFHLLIERDMTTTKLQQQAGFSSNIIPRMKRNGYVSLDTIESICRTLNCGVDDILEFVPDAEKEETTCFMRWLRNCIRGCERLIREIYKSYSEECT